MFALILIPKDTNRAWSGDQTWGPLLWGAEGCKAFTVQLTQDHICSGSLRVKVKS